MFHCLDLMDQNHPHGCSIGVIAIVVIVTDTAISSLNDDEPKLLLHNKSQR